MPAVMKTRAKKQDARSEEQERTRWVPKTTKAMMGTAEARGRARAIRSAIGIDRSVPRVGGGSGKGRAGSEGEGGLTEADDDVSGEVGHVREEDERAADADDADEAEHRDAHEQRERDLERMVRLVQRAPVLVQHRADVD